MYSNKANQKNKVGRRKAPASVSDSFLKTHPEIAKQWHPKFNGGHKPSDFTYGSTFEAWWKCPRAEDHVFCKAIFERTKSKSSHKACPYCVGKRESSRKRLNRLGRAWKESLNKTHPRIAKQWDYKKNEPWRPEDFTAGSRLRFWWNCFCGHSFESPISQRTLTKTQSKGCPNCRLEVLRGRRAKYSIAVTHPELCLQWDYTKNDDSPRQYTRGSAKKAWWRCPAGPDHEFEKAISARTRSHTDSMGCPFCYGKRPSVTNSLASLYPALAKEYSRKNRVPPNRILAKAGVKVIWNCSRCEKTWKASPAARVGQSEGCPRCNQGESINLYLPKYRYLLKLVDPSKNKNLDLKNLRRKDKLWWRCSKYKDHIFYCGVSKIKAAQKCPYCRNYKAAKHNSLATVYPKVAKEFHPTKNGKKKPSDFVYGSYKAVWWKCSKGYDHEWKAMIWTRTNRGDGCPFCRGQRPSSTNCLSVTHPEVAAEFHAKKNAPLTARDVVPGSHKRLWWQCKYGHEYQLQVFNRVKSKSGCPICRSNGRQSK